MGWEARVFYRPAAAAEVALVHESLKGPAEDRTDVYQSHSASVGLKLRGGGGLELKVREGVDGPFEKLAKHRLGSQKEASAMVRSLEEAGKAPVPPAAHAAAPNVVVQKQRRQSYVGEALVEQTELVISAKDSAASTEVWRTVAVEGKRKLALPVFQQLLAAAVAQAEGSSVLTFGYAGFVAERTAAWSAGNTSTAPPLDTTEREEQGPAACSAS